MRHFILLLFCFLVCPILGIGQNFKMDNFLDTRDGNTYEIIQIDTDWWFRENLRYETALSYCPNFNKKKDCKMGNFYTYQELDELCPNGWHVSKLSEWEAYFELMKTKKQVQEQHIQYETIVPRTDIMVTDTTKQLQLFDANNPLNLSARGWVQGKRRQKIGTITLWASNPELEDARFHLHIGPNSYVKHTHAHHIDDKRQKKRKFTVRCVKN